MERNEAATKNKTTSLKKLDLYPGKSLSKLMNLHI